MRGGSAPPRHVHQLRPVLVVVTVGANAQVERVAQPQRGELDLGHRADVAGEHRLVRPSRRERRQRGGRAGQRPPARRDRGPYGRRLRGQSRDERVHVPPRLRHPRQRQRLQDDRAVGAPRHRRRRLQRPPEQLQEHHRVQVGADPAGVQQSAVDIPEHKKIPRRTTGRIPHEAQS